MNFENSFSTNTEISLEREEGLSPEQELREKEKALLDFCEKNDNPIHFIRLGKEQTDEVTLSKDWYQLEEEWVDVLEEILKQAELFLRSPVFTDSFHENHGINGGRREWERDYIDKHLDPEIADYYKTNRLNSTFLVIPLLNFKSTLTVLEDNDCISDKLRNQAKAVVNKLSSNILDDLLQYNKFSDTKKLKMIDTVEPIFQEIVKLLSDK